MNVFKEMVCSIGKPAAYPGFLRNKKGKIFGYGVLLITFYFLLSALFPLLSLQIRSGGIYHVVDDVLPDFVISSDGFWMEEPFYYQSGGTYVDLDPEYYFNEETAYDFARGYEKVLLMDPEKIIVKTEGQVQTLYFSDLDDDSFFDKQAVLSFVPVIYGIILICLIFYYFWIGALFFFGVLLVSLAGMLLSAIMKAGLSFGRIYILSLYGRTLSLFIKGVLKLFGVSIPFFWVINFGITLVYLFLAMRRLQEQRELDMQAAYQQGMYRQDTYQQNHYYQGTTGAQDYDYYRNTGDDQDSYRRY